MKNKKTILTVIIVALLGGGYFYLNSAKAEKANLTEDDIKTIITESPKYGDLTVDVSATGILYSSKDVTVGAQASGQINKIEYKFYRAKENLEIDAALNSLSINFKNKETWWDVVDLFLKSGNKYLALKAQRYATF